MKRQFVLRCTLFALLALAFDANAVPLTFTGSSGALSASVSFDIGGGQLIVVLSNTSSADALVPTDVLTGVFFNAVGNPTFSRVSVVTNGSTFLNGSAISPTGTVVGGEYAYLNGLSQYSANSGISNSGLGIFGPGDVFPGANLEGPADPDGIQYGLTSAGDNPATGNAAMLSNSLTRSSVTITLGSLPPGFTLSSLSNITFQYGTALDEGHFAGGPGTGGPGSGSPVPEPETVALFCIGFLLMGLGRRRARSRT
jgi:PEP-CTERM motif